MAKQVKLAAQPRTAVGRNAVKKIKSAGFVPAVIYGNGGSPASLQVVEHELDIILAHAAGEHFLVELTIDGETKPRTTIVQDIQTDPVSRRTLHVDFQVVSDDKPIETAIPLEPTGEAVGVKSFGGLLDQLIRQVTVRALPKDLPALVQVDVSAMNIGDLLHIKDIPLPEGISIVEDGDIAVFQIAAPRVSAAAAAEGESK
ncbi:MAG TPA: 50S ribosomal protein L25 [Chthoniobacteraceae bacterium]|nr:50S ribosomal protein L25 [Chthoniobacteraceae bacterium]